MFVRANRYPSFPRMSLNVAVEPLDRRVLLSAAFDVTHLTDLRNDSTYSQIDGSGVAVAVLDTGIFATNPSLRSNVVAFYNAVTTAVPTTSSSDSVSDAFDNEGHGTHVAGTAAASDPEVGVAYASDIVSIHVLPDAGERQLGGDPLLRGLQFVARFADQYNIKVVNMSLGQSDASGGVNENIPTTADDISRAIDHLEALGITVVSASGNSYANDPTPGASYPAVVSTIGVASTWSDDGDDHEFNTVSWGASTDNFAAFERSAAPDRFSATSQRSTLANQVAAPGVDIFSTWNNSSAGDDGSDLLHNTLSGTSMASPFVSGLVALMQDAAFTFGGRYITDVNQVLSIIQQTADVIVDSNVSDNGRVPLENGSPDTSTQLNLPETGETYYRVNVLNAIARVRELFGGTVQPGEDTDNLISTAGTLPAINGTRLFSRVGNVGNDGLVDVGPDDIDLYKLVLNSPGSLTIGLTPVSGGTSFAASLRIFDSTGAEVARVDSTNGSYPSLTTDENDPLAIGTYYVGVSSLSNVSYGITDGTGAVNGATEGDYKLTVSLSNPDPNGVAQGAENTDLTSPDTIKAGTNVASNFYQGIIGSDPPAIGSTTRVPVPDGDVDMFKIVAPDTGTLTVDIDALNVYGSGAVDSYVKVLNASLQQIAANDDFGGSTDSLLQVSVTIGQTYYVAITNFANRTFDPSDPYGRVTGSSSTEKSYDLYLSFGNGDVNGTAFTAVNQTVGNTASGAVGKDNGVAISGANAGFKDVDFFRFATPFSGLLDLSATSMTGGFGVALTIWQYDGASDTIVQLAQTSGATARLIYQVSPGDLVYASVTGRGNANFNWYAAGSGTGGETGNYTLASAVRSTSMLTTLSDNSISNGTPKTLTAGTIIYGDLGTDDSLVTGAADVDMYKFVPTTSGLYDVRTDTSQEGSADTIVRVFDASGNQITSNDNQSASTTASFVRVNLTAGQTYYVGVSGANNDAFNANTGTGTVAGSTGIYGVSVAAATEPVVTVANVSVNEPDEGSTVATFTVTLDLTSSQVVTVTYATADGTATAGADYTSTSGTLTFQPGETSKTIDVPILGDTIPESSETFTLTLADPTGGAILGTEAATATILNLGVTVHELTASTPVRFADRVGNELVAKLSGAGSGRVIEIAGSETLVELTGTTDRTSVKISARAGASLGDVTVDGSLNAFSANGIDLLGDVGVSGSLTKLVARNATGVNITATGAGPKPTTFTLGDVTDTSLTVGGAIATLSTKSWTDTDDAGDVVTATRVSKLASAGNFAADVSLTDVDQPLSTATIKGVARGTWTMPGSLKAINAAALDDFVLTTVNLKTLKVTGSAVDSTVRASGGINAITVGSTSGSTFTAGVKVNVIGLPDDPSDFVSDQTIATFKVTSKVTGAFADTDVAAQTIESAALGSIVSDNTGDAFGLAGASILKVSRIDPSTGKVTTWKATSGTPAPTDGDFVARLVN
jgi:subtilisin family serine protease